MLETGPPVEFWNALSSSFNIVTIGIMLWLGSKMYLNVMKANKKPIYNTVNYDGCTIYEEKK